MDERKILLINLSKGLVGETNADLIGSMLITKIYLAAMSRADQTPAQMKLMPNFYFYVDEFQSFANSTFANILSEARKYHLNLIIAHQYVAQMEDEIRDAVFGNVGSMAAFRVGPEDAQFLEQQYSPIFTASDLMNIPNQNAYMRVLANGTPTPPFSVAVAAPSETDHSRVKSLIQQSYERYGTLREEIEEDIRLRFQKPAPPVTPAPPFWLK